MLLDRRVLSDASQMCSLELVPLSWSPVGVVIREKRMKYKSKKKNKKKFLIVKISTFSGR